MLYHVFIYISCYIAEIWISFQTVWGLGLNLHEYAIKEIEKKILLVFLVSPTKPVHATAILYQV